MLSMLSKTGAGAGEFGESEYGEKAEEIPLLGESPLVGDAIIGLTSAITAVRG